MFLFSMFAAAWLLFGHAVAIKNPIISGWNPDPAILRVDNEYYIATSSFEYFPGTPIYKSTGLANWDLYSYALTRPEQVQLYGVPTGAGVWAPSMSYINGRFYLASMTRWTYDPTARVWPRIMWISSTNMKNWTNPIWAEPWGIDHALFQDPISKKTYLNLMAPNNNVDRIWGIYQCQVNLNSGKCIGSYRSLWNGTLPHNSTARPEGPKMYYKDKYYYLLIAEGGTDDLHRSSIARSSSPEGQWTPAPNNPLIFNGAYGYDNLTVQSTGHVTMVDTPDGSWYASFLARRKVNGSSPLGRESFLITVTWKDGWPTFNDGKPILLSESFGKTKDQKDPPSSFMDKFDGKALDPSWQQLRVPYTTNYRLLKTQAPNLSGLVFNPNVFSLSDRDVPAAILRKQKSLNMTISARLSPISGTLGYLQSVGLSAYLSEFQHQDIGIRGCVNATGMCIYTILNKNGTREFSESCSFLIASAYLSMPHVSTKPLEYRLGFTTTANPSPTWLASIQSLWQAFAPTNCGNGQPWPFDAPEVGFAEVMEGYYEEDIPDYDVWTK